MRVLPNPWCRSWLAVVLLACLLGNWVSAEIRTFDVVLPPTDAYVHFTDGLIRAPGYIDLSALSFTAVSESYNMANDDAFSMEGDDGGTDDGGNNRRRQLEDASSNSSEVVADGSTVDVVVFYLPNECSTTRQGCDWTELGVGARLDDGTVRWCCSDEAIQLGLCAGGQYANRLMVNATAFTGNHRFINVPSSGPMEPTQIRYGKMEQHESGQYAVVFANCNPQGRDIAVVGETVWKSKHGYLPGELFGFMHFYMLLLVVYVVLSLWYGISMKVHAESRIPIEKWIFITIALGLLEMTFRTGDYVIWNANGYRFNVAMYLGILVGVFKRGFSRVLGVMVGLGWGVVRDSLGNALRMVIILGAAYIGVSAARELMLEFAVDDLETLSFAAEEELFDVATILTFAVSFLDVIFILWMLDALNGTMEYLENMNQTRKLMRYLRLRCILLFGILFATAWVIFSMVDTFDEEGIVREEHEWVVDAATELNYLFVLIGVAVLWRPNPSAREYAYVMELPASGGDGDTELELTAVVPSALDDHDDEQKKGYSDLNDDQFQIDDGEFS
jgi:hypothetical protein